jgi:hypothetical protein
MGSCGPLVPQAQSLHCAGGKCTALSVHRNVRVYCLVVLPELCLHMLHACIVVASGHQLHGNCCKYRACTPTCHIALAARSCVGAAWCLPHLFSAWGAWTTLTMQLCLCSTPARACSPCWLGRPQTSFLQAPPCAWRSTGWRVSQTSLIQSPPASLDTPWRRWDAMGCCGRSTSSG